MRSPRRRATACSWSSRTSRSRSSAPARGPREGRRPPRGGSLRGDLRARPPAPRRRWTAGRVGCTPPPAGQRDPSARRGRSFAGAPCDAAAAARADHRRRDRPSPAWSRGGRSRAAGRRPSALRGAARGPRSRAVWGRSLRRQCGVRRPSGSLLASPQPPVAPAKTCAAEALYLSPTTRSSHEQDVQAGGRRGAGLAGARRRERRRRAEQHDAPRRTTRSSPRPPSSGATTSYTIQRSRNSTRQRDFIFEDQTNATAQSNVADTLQDSAVSGDNYQETHQSARNRTRQRG